MRSSKKGFAGFTVVYGIGSTILFIVFIALLSSMLLNTFRYASNTHNIEYHLLENRLLFSRHSVFYEDNLTHRVYPWIVDPKKIDQEAFTKLVPQDSELAASITSVPGGSVVVNRDLFDSATSVYTNPYSYYGGSLIEVPIIIDGKDGKLSAGVVFKR
ncbi:MAG: hypothetical protein O2779_05740 [Nanoarchaeota archaeon]|nr:hypothetical protein [Nanoarchaeota archaeon]